MATISSCHTEAGMQGPWLSADETSSALQLLTAVRQLVVSERICLVLPLPDKEAPLSSLLGVFDAVCLETSRLHERSELVTLLTARQALGRVPRGRRHPALRARQGVRQGLRVHDARAELPQAWA